MGNVIVGNFGVTEGIQVFRVNGSKEDLTTLIEECHKMCAIFDETPTLEHLRRGEWTTLLKIKVPAKEKTPQKTT